MNLYLDLGNSALKWSTAPAPEARPARVEFGAGFSAQLAAAWSTLPVPQRVAAVTVASARDLAKAAEVADSLWGMAVEPVAAAARGFGVVNQYTAPAALGADRWAALVAARQMVDTAAVVVDCGTAWTVDALSAAGEFTGGVILAAPPVAAAAVAGSAEALAATPVTVDSVLQSPFALDTAGGVAAGAVLGAVGAVEYVVKSMARAAGEEQTALFLCGGGAELVLAHSALAFRHCPGLVLAGLGVMVAAGEGEAMDR
ncbi:MAG: type III pantothenate kinase [Gammaproteobacteria bacterium]|nr:type III pantothenate kinase [Gammaproteobacteria bacterium]